VVIPKSQDGLLKHSLILLVAQQLGNATTLGYQIVMGRTLSAPQFAILTTLLSAILVITIPATETVRASVAHFSARLVAEGRKSDVWVLMRQWYVYLAIGAGPLLLLSVAGSPALARFLHVDNRFLIVLTGMILAGSLYVPAFHGVLQGIQAFWWLSLVGQSWGVVRLLAGGGFVLLIGATALWALLGQLVAVGTAIGLGLWSLSRAVAQPLEKRARVPGTRRYGLFALPVVVGFAVIMNMDIIMVRHFLPIESENYARATTIAKAMVYISQPIASAMFPKVASAGLMSSHNVRTLVRAIVMAVVLIGSLAGIVLLVPELPMAILFKVSSPDAEMVRLLRRVVLALSPLGLAFLLMNFELAQHRFAAASSTFACAVAFVLLTWFVYHETVWQVVNVLTVCSVACLVMLLIGLPWRKLARETDTA